MVSVIELLRLAPPFKLKGLIDFLEGNLVLYNDEYYRMSRYLCLAASIRIAFYVGFIKGSFCNRQLYYCALVHFL